ncbi:uncharacterized protein LOC129771254 [Toxorhynchites rutilus septentrionalis]|uniref:uncharacterized protein LOC129771254 n=1 Tax=Toxorhynchites rutilus septentrionalis TaxID=329112 RepID=UPI002479276A|nr:uncharacterized protein LOC129771254 [Toxorhynchites rutilus septentrionalis]
MSVKDAMEQEAIEIEPLEEYECLELEKMIINEWGMQRSSLNRMIYCRITVRCLEVMQDAEINELFNDPRMLGQKIVFKHKVKEMQANTIFQMMNERKRRYHSAEMNVCKTEDLQDTLPSVKKIKTEVDPLEDTSLLEPEQSLESSEHVFPIHELPMENGTTVKASTAHAVAGHLPIRISPEGLRHLLQASRQGQWVLSYYSMYHTMNRKIQAALTHCIVEQFLVYNIMFSHRLMRHYAQVITLLFPTENAEVYYKPAQTLGWKRTCASGKLMDRWANQRMRHKDRYPQQRPRILDDTSDQRSFAEMSLVVGSNN